MTALDNIKAALEAGPPVEYADFDADEKLEFLRDQRDYKANLAAACSPSAIRELLAYVESLERDLAHIASLAHEGGIANLNETDALTYIRRLSLRYWKSDGAQEKQKKRACDAIDAAMEQTK